ncbi:MAG: TonB-dependent receptor, partial [Bacteroidetes bacterium]
YSYLFVNPKAGLTWRLSEQNSLYASVAVANREPVRSDFIDAPQGREPLPESLRDLEAGWRYRGDRFRAEASYYFMDYDNQLVLNGELNDVGASVRQNVKDSYRTGLEAVATYDAGKRWFVSVNAALSRNKIRRFEEYLYNYDPYEVEVIVHENTDISFSPALVAGTTLTFRPVADLELSLLGKYVSRQYLDNTRNAGRSLDPFFVSDLRLNWTLRPAWAREIRIGLIVNNLLNAQYEPNGYTFSYKLGSDLFTENYYYPQAGTNWIGSVALRF